MFKNPVKGELTIIISEKILKKRYLMKKKLLIKQKNI
jgi:hypothetical protein